MQNTNKEKIEQHLNNLLCDDINKLLKTIFIHDLATFEKFFGPFINNDDTLKSLWLKCREEILDFGNNHIRLLPKKFGRYRINSITLKEKGTGK